MSVNRMMCYEGCKTTQSMRLVEARPGVFAYQCPACGVAYDKDVAEMVMRDEIDARNLSECRTWAAEFANLIVGALQGAR